MKKVKHDKQYIKLESKLEGLKKDIHIALIDLLQIEEVEVLINGKWLTGEDALKYKQEDIMKNYFRKNCRDCDKCHIKC